MKHFKFIIICASVMLLTTGCQKEMNNNSASQHVSSNVKGDSPGSVYTISNEVSGNNVIVYSRSSSGMLTWEATYPTGGVGTGMGLGSQGAITLSKNYKFLLAVNAGSNSVSSFTVSSTGLKWASTVSSEGMLPISVTIHNNLVYVLNAGAANNVAGFTITSDGKLWPLEGSIRPLSGENVGPAQVSFTEDGSAIVITEKVTNKIVTYTIESDGTPGAMHSLTSANPTPFGFAVDKMGMIYVSEAVGGSPGASTVSSYRVQRDGSIQLIDGPNSAGQTAACWVVVVNNGKYVYATNTGSGNISSFKVDNSGMMDVLQAAAGVTGIGSSPIDAALSINSKYLYALLAGSKAIAAFEINSDGSVEWLQNSTGLPDGSAGLAAK